MPTRLVGIAFILAVSCIWIFASFLVKHLENTVTISPYIITLLSNACFVLLLPITFLRRRAFDRQSRPSDRQTIILAAAVGPLMWLEQYLFNLSLSLTSVSSNTILSSTASLFTFALSLIILREPFKWSKLVSLAVCFSGVVLVALTDREDEDNPHSLLGDGVTLLSALIYSCNTILLSRRVPDIHHPDTLLLFGFGGIWQLLIFGILGGVLVSFGWMSLRARWSHVCVMISKGLVDNVLTTVLWMQSVLMIGPTSATMGLALQWPLAIGADAMMGHGTWWSTAKRATCSTIGCLSILAGFVGINWPDDTGWKNGSGSYEQMTTTDGSSDETKSV